MKKRTKIVATIGPASERVETLSAMLEAGLNVARMNFSHGSHDEHGGRFAAFRAAMQKTGIPGGILQDLSGPKIRIGDFSSESIELTPGKEFVITTEEVIGDENRVSISYTELPQHVHKGTRIMLNDGKNELHVNAVEGNNIRTTVVTGGTIRGRRGVNVPGAYLPIKSFTEKDKKDAEFGIAQGVDYIGLSFVRTAEDIQDARALLALKNSPAQIIAKIETQEAMEHLDAIIEVADGIMVARGDLAVEIPPEQVPLAQKNIIARCMQVGKPVIVATHMLESMIDSPVPTRAEVSDVSNAVLDGTDAIMLSAESTLGKYPVEAVQTMTAIAETAEASGICRACTVSGESATSTDTVTEAIMHAAQRGHAKYIIALTETGSTARMLTRFRLPQEIIAFTPHPHAFRQLVLSYGCRPVLSKPLTSLEEALHEVRTHLLSSKIAAVGDTVVVAAGMPFGKTGSTNMLLLETL